ncbi:MAG: transposase [Janthinobacterium lividum]
MLDQPTVLVLDNASVHRAGCVQTKQPQWAAQGLTLFFLLSYSPELNRIEIPWRFCKHYWLPLAAYDTVLSLPISVIHLLRQIDSSDYQVTFA